MNPNAGNPSVVDAAREAAAAKSDLAAAQTPKEQFENQFGSPQAATPPVADNATGAGLIDAALASLGTPPPVADTSTPQPPTDNLVPEQTPAERLKKQIADSVDAFLEEVTREKVAA